MEAAVELAPYLAAVDAEKQSRMADVERLLAQKRALGFVYVVEFESGAIKVGKSTNPTIRLRSLATMAAVHGTQVSRQWTSPKHAGFATSERRLIGFCKQHGQLARGREYFHALKFELVREFADSLMAAREVDARRFEYVDKLIEAVGSDMSMTFREACRLLGEAEALLDEGAA